MTTYYVGPGGSDGNNGSTWALRKLTLNGAEDIGLVAGDTVIVGPGTYREQLTCDASGSSGGGTIHFQGDPTGALTDGIGGVCRITGMALDDDTTPTRDYCIYASSKTYREFSYLQLDGAASFSLYFANSPDGINIHDCIFDKHYDAGGGAQGHIRIWLASGNSFNIERCAFMNVMSRAISILGSSANGGGTRTITNCCFDSGGTAVDDWAAVYVSYSGDVYVRNCTILGGGCGIYSTYNTATYPVYVYNCLIRHNWWGMFVDTSGAITEDYNSLTYNNTARVGVTAGTNSNAWFWFPKMPLLYQGIKLGSFPRFKPSDDSQLLAKTDDGSAPSDDFFGITRPTVNGKRSWGAIQRNVVQRDTTITYSSSPASLRMIDAGTQQFTYPISGSNVIVSVRVRRAANYSGTLPQIVIKEPGQTPLTTTDTGSSETWNLLSDEFTPTEDYMTIELVSNNSASSGDYYVNFDALEVIIEP